MQRASRRLTLRPAHHALILAVSIAAGLAIAACGGTAPPTQTVTVTVAPATLKLAPGASAQVTATVTGTTDTGVTWTLDRDERQATNLDVFVGVFGP